MRGLLHHARAGKADERTRLGEDDVALHGKARRHAAGGGVGEHGQVEQPRLGVPAHRGGDLGHLHERGGALLHAGATGDGEAHDRKAELRGALKGAADLLAHDRAHRAHHELRVHEEERAVVAAHPAAPADHRVGLVALLARVGELLRVAGELQEVRGGELAVPFLEGPGVHRHAHALAPGDAQVTSTARTHVEVLGKLGLVDHPTAPGALDQDVALGELRGDLGHRALERVDALLALTHRGAPSGWCGSCRRRTRGWQGCRGAARCSRPRPPRPARRGRSASCGWPPRAWTSRR